jgi:hypothetical protein
MLCKTLTLKPFYDSIGTAPIAVAITDGKDTAYTFFNVTVTDSPKAIKPTISKIDNFYMYPNCSITFSLTVTGRNPDTLKVTASSSNTGLFPVDSILILGSSTKRILKLTPTSDMSGSSNITLTVKEGKYTVSWGFNASVIAYTKPQIDTIVDIVMLKNDAFHKLFHVDGSVLDSLKIFVTSTDTTLFPIDSLEISGDNFDRYVWLAPVHDKIGSSNITINVSDLLDTAFTTFNVKVVDNLSINDNNILNKDFIILFPNPAKNKLYLLNNLKNEDIESIEIRDMKGESLYKINNSNKTLNNLIEINVDNFTAGTYFCNIVTKNAIINKKFIIK